ncbi:MAG TPA: hypothetical protein VGF88_07535 [Acidobacteriaceae bacterium]
MAHRNVARPMESRPIHIEQKIFDPHDAATGSHGAELLDASLFRRGEQWWMVLAGQVQGYGPTDLFSASLPPGAPLSSTDWKVTLDAQGRPTPLATRARSQAWDGPGGRHCPSWVRGWDPHARQWVERIYYAGASENLWGPYTIGSLEWDGQAWIDQPEPVFVASQDWEHGSVYEPNLIYDKGKWKMWYVAGSNHEDYLVHGYTESPDGKGAWSTPVVFAPPEMKMFDFCVRRHGGSSHAIFARIWLKDGAPPETGLWWCTANKPSGRLSDWSQPLQIMTAEDKGWHSGPWKPTFDFAGDNDGRAFVFFDGAYRTSDPGPFPFAFTLGCLEIILPRSR